MISRLPSPVSAVRQPPHARSPRTGRPENFDRSRRRQFGDDRSTLTFSLKPVPPFRLDLTAWTLRRRASNSIDRWDGEQYRRVLVLQDSPFEVAVTQSGSVDAPQLHVTITGSPILPETKMLVLRSLERLLGLRIDLAEFHGLFANDARLGQLISRFRGAKPPRFPSVFEALVNAIACQQMSLSLGILLLSRLSEKFGMSVETVKGEAHAFPRPEDVVHLEPGDFRELGFSRQKARAIIAVADACSSGEYQGDELESLDNSSVVERLLPLRGIGRWSAEYVLLRGLGRLDVYPGDDVGACNNLKRWLGLRKPLDYDGVRRITRRWQPYAGLVYFHMLLDRLAASGNLAPSKGSAGSTPSVAEARDERKS
jgi:DNA-3-methyladenine glycosylase II